MTKKYRKKIPQILVRLDSSFGCVSSIQQGIQRYAKLYGPWKLDYLIGSEAEPGKKIHDAVRSTARSPYVGILARIQQNEDLELLKELKCPVVLIDPPCGFENPKVSRQRIASVALDKTNVGKLAADYFLNKKIRHFGFVPDPAETAWSDEIGNAFSAHLIERGLNPFSYVPPRTSTKKHFAIWIQQLPKPIALFAPDDYRARDILNVCQETGIAVPYEVLVLGVGNDEIFCESCFPTLSSVMVHWQRGGFAAAESLDLLMQRRRPAPIVYEAFEVVSRESSNQVAKIDGDSGTVTNNFVIRALEFIRINSGFCIQVEDVARHVGVSRQWLEKRFKSDMGYSVLEDIRRHRMERIKSLLIETELPINRIAEMSGYENANHLRIIFKKEYGMSMTDYRFRFAKKD